MFFYGGVMLKGRSIICPDDLSIEEIDDLFLLANDIIINKESYKESCNGYILATLFFESSTRTRLSFEVRCINLVVM